MDSEIFEEIHTSNPLYVIIVTFNGELWIKKCLKSLNKSTIPLKIIVIDNNSSDNTVEIIENEFQEVDILKQKMNFGFGQANNIGIKYALNKDAKYLFLLNQDAWIESDTLEKLITKQIKNPEYGILSPIHLNGKGNQLDEKFSDYIQSEDHFYSKYLNAFKIKDFDFINAAAWLVSRECILQVGLFDPLFKHYGEDRDFCNRALYYNFKIGVVTNAYIYHDRVFQQNNNFRKKENLLYASGLAHVKNINHGLFFNYITWFLHRSKKIIKYIVFVNIKDFYIEFKVLSILLNSYQKIKSSRLANMKIKRDL